MTTTHPSPRRNASARLPSILQLLRDSLNSDGAPAPNSPDILAVYPRWELVWFRSPSCF